MTNSVEITLGSDLEEGLAEEYGISNGPTVNPKVEASIVQAL